MERAEWSWVKEALARTEEDLERREHQIKRARATLEARSEPSNEWRRRLLTPDARIQTALDILSESESEEASNG